MRHGKKHNHLSRKKGHRKALLKNMANSLIEHKRINTTLAKAKALRVFLEPLVTKSKNNTTHSRRVVFSYLQNKDSIKELFGPIAGKVADRPGGYLRILKTGFRRGDAAEMCFIEFVDYNEGMLSGGSKRKRTRRRKKSSGVAEGATALAAADATEDLVSDATDEVTDKVEEVTDTVEEVVTDKVEEAADKVADDTDAGNEEE